MRVFTESVSNLIFPVLQYAQELVRARVIGKVRFRVRISVRVRVGLVK